MLHLQFKSNVATLFSVIFLSLFVSKTFAQSAVSYSSLYNDANFEKAAIDLTAKPVGAIDGGASVSPSGAVTYSIPIKVTPGTNGMVPSISIEYNSQSGNGVMGQGWNISGLSGITRAGNDLYHDGKVTPITYTNDDAFVLDGSRLVLKSGTYGADLATYRTEMETYSVTTSYGTGSPQYFNVVSKDGTLMQFGNSVDSRIMSDDGTKVMMWRLNKIKDINGNTIWFTYDNTDRDFRIKEIKYTGNEITGLDYYNTITFSYGTRIDKNEYYSNGYSSQSKYLLESILIKSEGEWFKEYVFYYGNNDKKSFLKKVIEFATSSGEVLNDTRFKYGDETNDFQLNQSNINVSTTPYTSLKDKFTEFIPGDFDGDGKSDYLVNHFLLDNLDYKDKTFNKRYIDFSVQRLSGMSGYSTSGTSTDSYSPIIGASDSWTSDEKRLVAYKNNSDYNFTVSDFDGDGKDDIFFFNASAPTSYPPVSEYEGATIYYSRKGSSGAFNFDKSDYAPASLSVPSGAWGASNHFLSGKNNIILGDFDGDKRTDYIYLTSSSYIFSGNPVKRSHAYVSFVGKGEINQPIMDDSYPTDYDQYWAHTMSEGDFYVLDMNGDGKSEIVLLHNTGCSIYNIKKSSLGHYYMERISSQIYPKQSNRVMGIGDFNGDGQSDLLLKSEAFWEIAFSKGLNFKGVQFEFDPSQMFQDKCTYEVGGPQPADRLTIGDFDGDGKSEILHESTNCANRLDFVNINTYYFTGVGVGNKMTYKKTLYTLYKRPHLYSLGTQQIPIVADVNGDGKQEISFSTYANDYINTLYFTPYSKSYLLEKINNGFNRTDEFFYLPLTMADGGALDFYAKGSGETYPINNSQPPVYVATAMTSPNGIGGTNTVSFKYENLRLHRAGKGLLGFEKVISIDPLNDIRSESFSDLNRDYYVPFNKTQKSFVNSTDVQLSQSNNTFYFSPKIGTDYKFKQQLTSTLAQDFLKGINTTTVNTFDADGNITLSTATTTGGETFVSSSATTYAATGGSSINNRPIEIISTSQRGTAAAVSAKTVLTYDTKGRLATKANRTHPVFDPALFTQNEYLYNDFGNIVQTKLVTLGTTLTPTTQYEYDSKGRFQIKVINQLGDFKTMTTHKFWGKPLSVTDYDGLTTTYTYDIWGKPTSVTIPTSTSTSYTVNYSDGWDLGTNQLYYTLVQDPSAPDTKTWYDYLGRAIKTEQETFGGAWITAKTTYNTKGNVATSTNNYLPTETPITTTNTYDYLNRISSSTNVFGTTSYAYAASSGLATTTVTLPDGKVKKSTVDATGKVIKSSNGIAGTVHYTYDSRGNEVSTAIGTETMSYNTLITKEYDNGGRLKKMTDPDAGATNYTYNAFGQLVSQTDPKGKITNYTYDTLGRISQKVLDGYTTVYQYWDKTKDYQLKKQTVTSADGVVEDYFDYATGGANIKHTNTTNGVAIEKNYTFDLYNRPIGTEYVNSVFKTLNYYDPNGFLTKITTNFTGVPLLEKTLYEATAMNGNGQITNFKRVDGLSATNTYYNGVITNYATPGIQDLSMTYNYANGNVLSRTDIISQTYEAFEYDVLDRLTKASATKMGTAGIAHAPLEMAYDNNFWGSYGRMISKSDVGAYTYSGFPRNAVKSVTDPASIISHETQNVEYNPFHKTKKITEKVGGIDYEEKFVYDASEDRAYSQQTQGASPTGSIVRKRWYDGDFEIDQKIIGSSTETRKLHYISSDAGLVTIVKEEGGVFTYYAAYTDHLGSIVTLTDDVGSVVAKQSYDAWGRERNPDTWGYTVTTGGTTPIKPDWLYRGYTGHEMLPEYGLINMNGRMYDPLNGRMMRPDNFVTYPDNSQSYNRYSYAMNNPLSYVDPDGNNPILIGMAVGALSGAITSLVTGAHFGQSVLNGAMFGFIGGGLTGGLNMVGTALGVSGVLPGALWGGVSGAASGGLVSGVSKVMSGGNFTDDLIYGVISGAIGGSISGGISGGMDAFKNGKNIWYGTKPGIGRSQWSIDWGDKPKFVSSPIEPVNAGKANYCFPGSMKSISKSYGENSQSLEWWANKYENFSKTKFSGVKPRNIIPFLKEMGYKSSYIDLSSYPDDLNPVFESIHNGNRVGLGTQYYGPNRNSGHFMVVKSMKLWPNGNYVMKIMDPNGGYFRTLTNESMYKLPMFFSISK